MRRLVILVVLVTVSAIACKIYLGLTDAALGAELVQNPGFETAGAGGVDIFADWWEGEYYNYLTDVGTGAGSGVTDSATAHGGTHAAQLTAGVIPWQWREVSQEIVVTPGARYRFSFWHRGDGTNSARYALRNTVTNELIGSGGAVSTGNISVVYAQTTVDFYAPAGCTTISIQLGTAFTPGSSVYVDDVSLKEVTWSWVDKSADVLASIGAVWNRGMGARLTDLVAETGILTFSLDNSASNVAAVTRLQGQYSPGHANCLAGFEIGCPVKVTLNVDAAGETTEFIGRIASIRPSSGIYRGEVVEVEAHDWMGYLSTQPLGLQTLATSQRIDQGITTALADLPIQPTATSFGTGVETFLTMFDTEDSQTSMASFFSKLARCEFGRIYLTGAGTLVVEHRRVRAENLTPAFTLDGTMSELGVAYNQGDISNVVIVRTYPARIDTVAVRIWDLANAGCPKIEPGETFTMTCPFRDPEGGGKISATSVVNPVTVVEFGSAPDYSSNDLASFLTQANEVGSNQMIVHLTNTSSKTGYLNDFQVYGLGIYHYAPIEIEKRDTFSIASGAGEQKQIFDLEQIGDPATGANFADFIADKLSRQHLEGVLVEFRANQDTALAALATAIEISQRFTLTEAQTGLSEDFFVNKIEYRYKDNQLDVSILGVPASRSDCWIWDTSTWDNTEAEGWTL